MHPATCRRNHFLSVGIATSQRTVIRVYNTCSGHLPRLCGNSGGAFGDVNNLKYAPRSGPGQVFPRDAVDADESCISHLAWNLPQD